MISLHTILCPVDLSEGSRTALAYAARMARWYGARVTALHVVGTRPIVEVAPPFRGQALALVDSDPAVLRRQLAAFVDGAGSQVLITTVLAEAPDVRTEIVRQAGFARAELIVMGSHGRTGFEHLLLGSVAEHVVRHAPCPVMLVPPGARAHGSELDVPFTRILCAVDFAGESTRALSLALELAEEADAQLTLLHAIEVPPELRAAAVDGEVDVPAVRAEAEAEALRRLRGLVPIDAHTYCKIHTDVREGPASRHILDVAAERHATLIVMGVHGGGFLDRLLFGSNTHAVLAAARCPVLAVRTPAAATTRAVA